jgi:hypothetical protein
MANTILWSRRNFNNLRMINKKDDSFLHKRLDILFWKQYKENYGAHLGHRGSSASRKMMNTVKEKRTNIRTENLKL